jgi:cytochrome c-type biogenesis protein CcmF
MMFLGFLGQAWHASGQASLEPGESFTVQDYVLRYDRFRVEADAAKEMYIADFVVTDTHGKRRGSVSPAKFVYRTHKDQPTSEVDVLHSLRDDLYVVLGSLSQPSGRAAIQVYVNPLVSFIWLGVVVLVLGASISLWPRRSSVSRTPGQPSPAPEKALEGATGRVQGDAHAS